MDAWYMAPGSWNKEQIAEAVNNEHWQQFRRSLKGLPTSQKLNELRNYWVNYNHVNEKVRIRVDNYINALRRGGFLDECYQVIK